MALLPGSAATCELTPFEDLLPQRRLHSWCCHPVDEVSLQLSPKIAHITASKEWSVSEDRHTVSTPCAVLQ